MFHERMFLDDWEDKNVQPGRKPLGRVDELPICPNYEIIEICAQLAGTPPKELAKDPQFCGNQLDYILGSYWPKVACWEIQKKLTTQLEIAKSKLPEENIDIDSILKSNKSLDEREAELKKYRKNMNEKAEKEEILTRFRRIVFDKHTLRSTNETRKNPHFKTVRNAKDLTEEEILTKVGQFINKLSEITGRTYYSGSKLTDSSEITHPAKNCKQCPTHYDPEGFHCP